MLIDHEHRAIDFSDNTTGKLSVHILKRLRDAIDCNDFYCNLVFDNNVFTDDALGILAAILKGCNPIERLSLRSCNLTDLELVHLAQAICTRKSICHLDLSKNPGITSSSCAEITRIIQNVPSLESLLLIGTGLQEKGCSYILQALERNPTIRVLELPFTVGYRVLDKARLIIEKKTNKPEKAGDTLEGSKASHVDDNRMQHSQLLKSSVCLPSLEYLPLTRMSKGFGNKCNNSYVEDLLELPQWADPSIMNAAVYLKVLDKRCEMLDEHIKDRHRRMLARRGQL
uniref:WGS project CAEQ00000000 data, annotated contig 1207 n=1 Tax=Trypanosoma congolense (strain IL3000) TaxID=1068625 RepID=F9W4P0_TRYCI|nr:unnamed protein product [Trypanosoma congolense IL3000]